MLKKGHIKYASNEKIYHMKYSYFPHLLHINPVGGGIVLTV